MKTLIILIILNILLFFKYQKIEKFLNIYDLPIQIRKIHKKKTPLIGGFFLYINLIFFSLFFFLSNTLFYDINFFFGTKQSFLNLFFFGSILFFIGAVDDKINLNANLKFLLFLVIIILTVLFDKNLILKDIFFKTLNLKFNTSYFNSSFSIFFTVLCFMLFLNASNMFDGINFQTGPYFLGIFLLLLFKFGFSTFLLSIILPILVFCYLNYNGKIFFGNSGINLISFITAYILIKQYNSTMNVSVEEIFLIMSIPGYDMLRLFILRIKHKKSPFSSDKNHLHHLMLKKIKYSTTKLIINIVAFIPITFFLVFNTFYIVPLSLLFYLCIYLYFK